MIDSDDIDDGQGKEKDLLKVALTMSAIVKVVVVARSMVESSYK
jgi:hypothetical protein